MISRSYTPTLYGDYIGPALKRLLDHLIVFLTNAYRRSSRKKLRVRLTLLTTLCDYNIIKLIIVKKIILKYNFLDNSLVMKNEIYKK